MRGSGIVVAGIGLFLLLASPALAFPDVPSDHPYVDAIEDLAADGIVSGKKDGSFAPEEPVRRAQFAKMITGSFGIGVSEDDPLGPFVDLGPDDLDDPYPHEYVAAAYFNGITEGKTATIFEPYTDIARGQVVTMVVRALDELHPGLLEDAPPWFQGTWGDFWPVHGEKARKAEWNDLLWGLGRTGPEGEGDLARLDPWGKMPRGEVAQVLHNVRGLIEDLLPFENQAEVIGVLDGETMQVIYQGQEETVRLIGIDAPEIGEPYGDEAREALEGMVGGQLVGLEFDVLERDEEGRLLAYVWYPGLEGPSFANYDLLMQGLGLVYTVDPNVDWEVFFLEAQEFAQELGLGIWSEAGGAPVELVDLQPVAGGDDPELNDEWLEFEVLQDGSLAGFAVEDAQGHRYEFPERFFSQGQVFKLHSGSGRDSDTHLYWDSGYQIWNDDEDTVRFLDSEDHVLWALDYMS